MKRVMQSVDVQLWYMWLGLVEIIHGLLLFVTFGSLYTSWPGDILVKIMLLRHEIEGWERIEL